MSPIQSPCLGVSRSCLPAAPRPTGVLARPCRSTGATACTASRLRLHSTLASTPPCSPSASAPCWQALSPPQNSTPRCGTPAGEQPGLWLGKTVIYWQAAWRWPPTMSVVSTAGRVRRERWRQRGGPAWLVAEGGGAGVRAGARSRRRACSRPWWTRGTWTCTPASKRPARPSTSPPARPRGPARGERRSSSARSVRWTLAGLGRSRLSILPRSHSA